MMLVWTQPSIGLKGRIRLVESSLRGVSVCDVDRTNR
jgi:hypothetical protein